MCVFDSLKDKCHGETNSNVRRAMYNSVVLLSNVVRRNNDGFAVLHA